MTGLSWVNRIAKLVFKVSHRLGILRLSKSFLGKAELHTVYKTFVRPRDQLIHRVRFRTGSLTLATVHAEVSSGAQHGLPVHDREDPGRSQLQLQPLLGICLATVAVAVSTHASHSYYRVSRDPHCTPHSHSYSHRD